MSGVRFAATRLEQLIARCGLLKALPELPAREAIEGRRAPMLLDRVGVRFIGLGLGLSTHAPGEG